MNLLTDYICSLSNLSGRVVILKTSGCRSLDSLSMFVLTGYCKTRKYHLCEQQMQEIWVVYIRNFQHSGQSWIPAIISRATGPVSYQVMLTSVQVLFESIWRSTNTRGVPPTSSIGWKDFGTTILLLNSNRLPSLYFLRVSSVMLVEASTPSALSRSTSACTQYLTHGPTLLERH